VVWYSELAAEVHMDLSVEKCWNRGTYSEFSRTGSDLTTPRAVKQYNVVMSLVGLETKNDCADKGHQKFTGLENTVQQTWHLHRKTDHSLVEEEAPLLNTWMSRREKKSWSWIPTRSEAKLTELARVSSNLTDRPNSEASSKYIRVCVCVCVHATGVV
jgi:hypothetical protein